MGQVNISYDDQQIIALDKVAAARRMSRPELLRAIATEAIEAHDAGRLAFEAKEGPKLDTSLNSLAAQLREAVIELDRAQRDHQRHEKKIQDAWLASEENILVAQQELIRRVNDTNRESYQPFVQKLRDVKELIAMIVPKVADTLDIGLTTIDQRLTAIHKLAKEPRTQYQIVFGDDRVWSTRLVVLMALIWGGASVLLFLGLANMTQPLAISLSDRLLDDRTSLCRLVERRFGTLHCEVPNEDRAHYARIRKLENRR
jgi:hypothetical protein